MVYNSVNKSLVSDRVMVNITQWWVIYPKISAAAVN